MPRLICPRWAHSHFVGFVMRWPNPQNLCEHVMRALRIVRARQDRAVLLPKCPRKSVQGMLKIGFMIQKGSVSDLGARTFYSLPSQLDFSLLKNVTLFEPPHDKTSKMACAPNEDSDQPGHPPSLIRVFAVGMKKPWVIRYPLSAQRRL